MRSPAGASFFASGLLKSPPNVEPVVIVDVPGAVPSFFSPSLGGPKMFVVVAGVASFFSSGFVASLFAGVTPNSPADPKEELPVVGGTGVDVLDVSGILAPSKPPLNAGVVVEADVGATPSAGLGGSPKNPLPNAGTVVWVDAEVVALSTGLGGSPRKPPGAGVVVDKPLGGLGPPPKNPPVVVLVVDGPPKRPPDVAIESDQHQESNGLDSYLPGFGASLFSVGFDAPNSPPPKAGAEVVVPLPPVSRIIV